MGDYNGVEVWETLVAQNQTKLKKIFWKLFKENELDIVIQCNMKAVNYLDVTLNLENSTYRPYQKKMIK